jgi:flagellar motility protein MotE (MotC chaperone)
MGLHLPAPRLLPLTIATMGTLALVKAAVLTGLLPAQGPAAGMGAAALVFPARAESTGGPVAAPAVGPPASPAQPGSSQPGSSQAASLQPGATSAGSAPGATAAGPAPVGAASLIPAAPPPAISATEMGLLQDLRARRSELDARQGALDARQAVLDASEKRLSARVDELAALQSKLEALEAARKQREETNWSGLVKLYEAMKPRDAAGIFNDLEMPILLQILDRMKEAKAAPILAAMEADRAREATTKLAEMRLRETKMAAPGSGG